MKRWVCRLGAEEESPFIDAFLLEIEDVYKRHGMTIGHEDGHGSFQIEVYTGEDDLNVSWLSRANDKRGDESFDERPKASRCVLCDEPARRFTALCSQHSYLNFIKEIYRSLDRMSDRISLNERNAASSDEATKIKAQARVEAYRTVMSDLLTYPLRGVPRPETGKGK